MLVDMWSSICSSSNRADVVFQAPALLLASRLVPVPANVQGCTTCGTGGVLLQPGAQTRAGNIQYTQYNSQVLCYFYVICAGCLLG